MALTIMGSTSPHPLLDSFRRILRDLETTCFPVTRADHMRALSDLGLFIVQRVNQSSEQVGPEVSPASLHHVDEQIEPRQGLQPAAHLDASSSYTSKRPC